MPKHCGLHSLLFPYYLRLTVSSMLVYPMKFLFRALVFSLLTCSTLFAQQLEDASIKIDMASLLDPVQDRTMGIPPQESAAYYQLLYTVAHEDATASIKRARDFWKNRQQDHPEFQQFTHPPFADLFKNPVEYRGQIITQTGYAQRIVKYAAGENEFGIKTLYEAWIYPESGQSNPIVVVFTVPPGTGMSLGDNLNYRIGVTGYFFKLYGYPAQDTTRLAPMILAGALEPLPTRIDPGLIEKRIYFFLGAFVFVMIVMGWILYTGLRKKPKSVVQSSLPDQLPALNENTEERPDSSD
ncbi:hypothetical protein Pla110_39140 [Polystyrenella longa]|uniref:Uncharacterized protein n=1 Tax=Polystyrenella longa TaxID=2528007 RepID=A0A518CSE4_9PLAN|nr:hypothetical protein [Polystyrenella longa]QDU82159.1 hypothetical protein Pla110_39140 [Polystyrenella longa]